MTETLSISTLCFGIAYASIGVETLIGMFIAAGNELEAASEAWKAAGEPTDLAGLVAFIGNNATLN